MEQRSYLIFAEKCKTIRKSKETIKSISDITGMSTRSVAALENSGKSTLISICKYADALGCHLELVPNNKKETQAPSELQKMTDAELVELNSLRRILSIIKELVK